MSDNVQQIDINANELVEFLIKNKSKSSVDITKDNFSSSGNHGEIRIRLDNSDIIFQFNSYIHHNTNEKMHYILITKVSNNSDINSDIYLEISENLYNRIKNNFTYSQKDLEAEIKKMIRGDKLDDVLEN